MSFLQSRLRVGGVIVHQLIGSNFARLNYQGFYTFVLEKGDELISVASIRVHGVTVAEMPLIATCSERRRQGMCRRLLGAIEEMLKSLKVELLVLSAIPDLVDTWISGFGYKPIEDNEKKRLRNISLMSFPGTVVLKKTLYEGTAGKENGWLSSKEETRDYAGFDIETEQQHYKTVRKELDREHKRSVPSYLSPSPTPVDSKHGDFSKTAVGTVGASNTCEMNELSSIGLVTDAELQTALSPKETDLPTRNLGTTQLAHVDPEDSASDTRLKERSFYHCEGDEAEHVCAFEASDAT